MNKLNKIMLLSFAVLMAATNMADAQTKGGGGNGGGKAHNSCSAYGAYSDSQKVASYKYSYDGTAAGAGYTNYPNYSTAVKTIYNQLFTVCNTVTVSIIEYK